MYDPMTFGTPLTLLQIPQQAIQMVQKQVDIRDCSLTHYTQDCKDTADLQATVSARDFDLYRETYLDVGYICKKCHMVYPGRDACIGHQQTMCYQGDKGRMEKERTILKLEQKQFECVACKTRCSTVQECKEHCEDASHKQQVTGHTDKTRHQVAAPLTDGHSQMKTKHSQSPSAVANLKQSPTPESVTPPATNHEADAN